MMLVSLGVFYDGVQRFMVRDHWGFLMAFT